MSDIDELRASMRQAQASGRGSYVEDGQHLFTISKVLYKRTVFEGKTKESYIAELTVNKSSNPTHEVGSTRSYIENPQNLGWLGRFKSFLAAAAGLDPTAKLSNENEELLSDVIAAIRYDEFRVTKGWPENFFGGRTVACEGSKGASKSGSPVTNKRWSPVAAPST